MTSTLTWMTTKNSTEFLLSFLFSFFFWRFSSTANVELNIVSFLFRIFFMRMCWRKISMKTKSCVSWFATISSWNWYTSTTSTNSKMTLRSRSNRDFVSSSVANFLAFQTIFVYLKLSVFLYVLLCSFQVFCQNSFRKIVNFDNDTRNVKIDRSCSCASKAMINSMCFWFHQHLIHTIFSHQFVFSHFDFHQVFHDDFYQDFHQDFH